MFTDISSKIGCDTQGVTKAIDKDEALENARHFAFQNAEMYGDFGDGVEPEEDEVDGVEVDWYEDDFLDPCDVEWWVEEYDVDKHGLNDPWGVPYEELFANE